MLQSVRLSSSTVRQWRDRFSGFHAWGIGEPFGEKTRTLLATLDPPFIPEDEALVFDPSINYGEYKIAEITYQNVVLRDGFFFGTDSRLIFGNRDAGIGNQKGIVFQIPYSNIKAAYGSGDNYSLVLSEVAQVTIRTKIPRPSLLGAVAIMGGSPVDKATISRMERAKSEGAQDFASTFIAFFTEIADDNRDRRGVEPAVSTPIQTLEPAQPQLVATSPTSGVPSGPPIVIQKPWYRSSGCLVLAFLFALPIWSVLILTNNESRTWVKWVAGIFLALWIVFILMSMSQ